MNPQRKVILTGFLLISIIFIAWMVRLSESNVHRNDLSRQSNNYRPGNVRELESQEFAAKRPSAVLPLPAEKQNIPIMIDFPKEGIPVLMFHSISTIPGNSLGVPVKQFSDEMTWLYRQNYHTLSLEEFYEALNNKSSVPEKPVLLTFDDGYADNYSSAWPILQQNGFKAVFFIVTGSVGSGMMNWSQLNDLILHGNSVGSHTVHHLDLAALSNNDQRSELLNSKQELDNHLDTKLNALCFPSGQYNATTLNIMPKLGYKLGFTTKPGRVHLGDNLLTLKRIRIYGGMPLTVFQKLFP